VRRKRPPKVPTPPREKKRGLAGLAEVPPAAPSPPLPPPPPFEPLISVKEVSRMMAVHPRTVQKLAISGKLPHVPIIGLGRKRVLRFNRKQIVDLLTPPQKK
jgi:excisionase family DNA binding protein